MVEAETTTDLDQILPSLSKFPSHIETGPIGIGSVTFAHKSDSANISDLAYKLENSLENVSLFPELQLQMNDGGNDLMQTKQFHQIILETAEQYGADHEHYNHLKAFSGILLDKLEFQKSLAKKSHKKVLLLGNSGTGKSLLGNIILGDFDKFAVSKNRKRCTKGYETGTNDARKITVIDTPGLFDSKTWKKLQGAKDDKIICK